MHTLVILAALALLGWLNIRSTRKMSDAVQRLTAAAAIIEGRVDAAAALFEKLAGIIRDLKNDPAELEALATRLEAQGYELGQSIESFDPDAQPPVEEPPVGEETTPGTDTETGADTSTGSDSEPGSDSQPGEDSLPGTDPEPEATLTDFKAADEASGKSKRK